MQQIRSTMIIVLALTPAFLLSSVARAEEQPPQIMVAWPAGPLETRISFDRPVDQRMATALVGKSITLDGRVRTVGALQARGAPIEPESPMLGTLRIAAARLADGRRTLVLTCDPHSREAVYSLVVPIPGRQAARVMYDLTGVEAVWDNGQEGAAPEWSGWWPSLDSNAMEQQTQGSLEHEHGIERLHKPGQLTLRTLITFPEGRATLRIDSQRPIVEASLAGEGVQPAAGPGGTASAEFAVDSAGDVMELSLVVRTGPGPAPFRLAATYRAGASAAVPLPRLRQAVPWSPGSPPAPGPGPPLPDISGGDPLRGEKIFHGEAARCANCHQVRGKGKSVGPDLTPLAGRERAAVYRDIAEPSALIRPDYVPYTVALKDGRVVVGIVRAEGAEAIRVTDTEAKVTLVRRAEIEELRPSATSIMPVGLAGAIGEAGMRDLLAFLTSPSPENPARAKP